MLDTEASIIVKKKDKEQAGLTTQPYRRVVDKVNCKS